MGSSPRGRGNRGLGRRPDQLAGFIPAWAGKPNSGQLFDGVNGFIPAWAGKPRPVAACLHWPGVHPRVGGETTPDVPVFNTWAGSSPRGRGNHRPAAAEGQHVRFIPAWAGKPRRAR